jgi:arylsulfatase
MKKYSLEKVSTVESHEDGFVEALPDYESIQDTPEAPSLSPEISDFETSPEPPAERSAGDELQEIFEELKEQTGYLKPLIDFETHYSLGLAYKDMELLDDTLIYLMIGDNGASAEGTLQGAFNEMANFNGMAGIETPEFMKSKLD